MKSAFLDKLMERLDRVDPGSLQTHFLRLAREKGLLETLFRAVREGIIVLDGRGRITYANRAAEQMLGFQADAAAGQSIRRFLREMDWDRLLELDPEEWSRLVSREIEITYPERRLLDFYVVPLTAVAESERGAVVLLRDVTSDRDHEARAVESERLNALTLLAAGVAHEIGNPLNSLHIHLQLIERELGGLPPEKRRELVDLVEVSRREVERLDGILTQFLRALRPAPPNLAPGSVADVLRETLNFLQHEIRDRDVLVEVEAPEALPAIPIDADQIKQAFFNIIRNAIQAMPGGGLLKITLRETDRFVEIAFRDRGPGIPPEDIHRIFEPYQTTRPDGSGLGLAIVQRIVRDHGGQIEVHSRPGEGTTFTLLLPRTGQRLRLLQASPDLEPAAPDGGPP
ncbi:MAG TPA: ATP-binding protein [Kiritimatiellia bacterium]|nr:ATP-binding protein [Kiritimatiellia bacterium]HRZ12772.1 ATP-binding protein [Kiritimatiellia bacterium]HSA18276.1 ATP-binding protein [Kiritimatiellia bacterium]